MCLGTLGLVRETWDEGGMPMARVESHDGSDLVACLAYTPEAAVGTQVLVHLGFVVEVVDPDVAGEASALRSRPRGAP